MLNDYSYVEISDEVAANFWNTLKNAKIDEQGEFLHLPGDTYLSGLSILFIRKCYRDLIKVVFDREVRRIRISGNPGIGKTIFAYYVLYLLVQQGETILFDKRSFKVPIVFEKERAFRVFDQRELNSYLGKTNVWYICDAKEPSEVHAKTILVSSLRKQHYKEFDKYTGTTIRYMPVWSWEEIETCRNNIFNDLEVTNVKDLFLKWGGIPRFTLAKAQDKS